MRFDKNTLILFSTIAGVNLLVFSFVLFFKKQNAFSNKLLGGLIFIPGFALISNAVLYAGGFYNHPLLLNLVNGIGFAFGPTLILYIHLMEGHTYIYRTKDLLHLTPILFVIIYSIFIALQSQDFIRDNYNNVKTGTDPGTNLIYIAQFFHFATYITWGIRKIKRYKKHIKNNLSTYEGVNYKWLWFFVTRLLGLNIILLAFYSVQMVFFPNQAIFAELLATPLAASCFYPIIFFKSLSNHLVFDKKAFEQLLPETNQQETLVASVASNKEIEPENIERFTEIQEELENLLNKNKIYTAQQLSVHQLANTIGCGRTLLSQTINRMYGITFFELINIHRVDEAKRLLLNKKYFQYKIETIGEMAGFSSRTSFFSVFKKYTKLSPAQYREQKNTSLNFKNS